VGDWFALRNPINFHRIHAANFGAAHTGPLSFSGQAVSGG
jgi:hypothetical protein